ncbi:hypothetical protein GCM10017781_37990 [Deinococcus metalli]|uniref:Uncharacterized protein n=1 Tax=Deinococcus metalli TaxID=1141878 RepID=A0ABQ3JT57_9DEIO|nr:hypothetical protein GCM10017781_37990 [Deinococcus metalli]
MVALLVLAVAVWGGWALKSTVKWDTMPGMDMSGGAAMPGMAPAPSGPRR